MSRIRVSAVLLLMACAAVLSQQPALASGQEGTVSGRVTATAERIPLPGITIILRTSGGHDRGTALSGPDGRFRITGVPEGAYLLVAHADGFDPCETRVAVQAGRAADATCDMKLSAVMETVEVSRPRDADAGFGVTASIGARTSLDGALVSSSPLMDGDVTTALRMMAGVVQRGTALSIRGGRSNQSRMEIDGTDISDPATGESWYRLPGDAVAMVEILASPPAVEHGRFASGVTLFQSKRGGPRWEFTLNNLEPGLITKRRHPLRIIGLESMSPRVTVGGPLVKDRLFITESAQLRYMASEIMSRPQDERRRNLNVSNFVRADGVASPSHTVTGTVGMYWKRLSAANIDTFTPPDGAARIRYRAAYGSLRDSIQLAGNAFLETRAQWGFMNVSTEPEGTGDYVLAPDLVSGAFFNTQDRWSRSWHGSAAVGWSADGPLGSHLMKAGIDLRWASLRAESESRRVRIARANGTTAGEILFGRTDPWRVRALDAGVYVQDRWQPHSRVAVEGGLRLDRDGVFGAVRVSPRAGAVLALRSDQNTAIRTSIGVFRERMPLGASAFANLEPRTEVLWPAGTSSDSPVVTTFVPVLGPVRGVPRSITWNLGINHRFTKSLTAGVQYIQRLGAQELVVDPAGEGRARSFVLSSKGRSRYRDAEVTARFSPGPAFELTAAYTRASSWSDLNAYSVMYGDLRSVALRPDVFARTDYDVPRRLMIRSGAQLGPRWIAEWAVDWRSGFPWSALDETLQYVGAPNEGRRFPSPVVVSAALERRIRVWKLNGWAGVRVFNLPNTFMPLDVQRRVDSPRFGGFFDSDRRTIRVGFRMR